MSPCSSQNHQLIHHVFVRKRIKSKAPMRPSRPSFITPPEKYKSLKEIMKFAKRCELKVDDEIEIRCEKCNGGDRAEEMLLCDKCDGGFHMFCLSPIVVRIPIGAWFCPTCSHKKIVTSFPLLQTKIVDFFRIEKCIEQLNPEKCSSLQDSRKRRRRSEPLVMYKRRRRMLPFSPTQDDARKLEQMGSLATALTALHMEFSNDLTYISGMAPKSANQASLEHGGMQGLSKEDKETLEQCRAMWKRGEWPPLVVVFDTREGYTVEADSQIKDMTLISEYTGDVDFIKNREDDDCDSMMTLLSATDTSKSLVICPDKRGNIARFINGINNHTPEGRKKQNLKCVRYNVNGECRVLLVAIRDIAKGERLYYDYNGYEYAYPTYHFI
ncbi:putative Histone-lysine N-methyltransferase atxr5 [Ranunculus cassubicifolius]